MLRDDYLAAARALIGTPFVHQGRTRHGVDCIGLIVLAAQAVGIDTRADRTDYGRRPHGVLQPILDAAMVKVTDWQPGDTLVMAFRHEPMHVAIYTGATVIHTYATLGKVVEHDLDARWRARVAGAYRLRELV